MMIWNIIKPFAWFLFYPAVFIAAWVGGFRVGVIATALSAVLGWYFFIPTGRSFSLESPRYIVSIIIFATFGVVLAFFREQVNKSNRAQIIDEAHRQNGSRKKFSVLACAS